MSAPLTLLERGPAGAAAAPTTRDEALDTLHVRSAGLSARVAELDVLRGLVIVLMALDHVRHYFHASAFAFNPLDPAHTTPVLYATRWLTHLCAPTFVFLAGVSAYLQLARGKAPERLALFLLKRGVWLVALELTAVSFGWSFSFPYPPFLKVIWAIGWSMIALAALVRLRSAAVLAIGLVIVAGHNLLDPVTPEQLGRAALLWTFLHEGGPLIAGGQPVGLASYPILPWIGVMALGYGLGPWFAPGTAKPNRVIGAVGIALLAAFLMLRGFNLYGDGSPWRGLDTWGASAMSFLAVTKYPPSLHYVLVTLGIVLALWPALAKLRGPAAAILGVFGSAPLFFYVLHIYLIHALAIAANAAARRDIGPMFDYMANSFLRPEVLNGLGFGLPVVYAAWLLVLLTLYPLTRWFGGVKAVRRDSWLSYL